MRGVHVLLMIATAFVLTAPGSSGSEQRAQRMVLAKFVPEAITLPQDRTEMTLNRVA